MSLVAFLLPSVDLRWYLRLGSDNSVPLEIILLMCGRLFRITLVFWVLHRLTRLYQNIPATTRSDPGTDTDTDAETETDNSIVGFTVPEGISNAAMTSTPDSASVNNSGVASPSFGSPPSSTTSTFLPTTPAESSQSQFQSFFPPFRRSHDPSTRTTPTTGSTRAGSVNGEKVHLQANSDTDIINPCTSIAISAAPSETNSPRDGKTSTPGSSGYEGSVDYKSNSSDWIEVQSASSASSGQSEEAEEPAHESEQIEDHALIPPRLQGRFSNLERTIESDEELRKKKKGPKRNRKSKMGNSSARGDGEKIRKLERDSKREMDEQLTEYESELGDV